MLYLNTYFKRQPRWLIQLISILLVLLIGGVDYLTGYELSFSLFYLFPILVSAWYTTKRKAFILSIFSAVVWLISSKLAGQRYDNPLIHYWNMGIRLGFFLISIYLLTELKLALEREKRMSREDFLTKALSRRSFYELSEAEINRCLRFNKPLTIAYIDLDNFKTVNDKYGHETGDKVLVKVVQTIKLNLRKIDLIARLGGDEFILLLVEVDFSVAQAILSKIQQELLNEMQSHQWPITFSFGVLIYLLPPNDIDEAIKATDKLMYEAKNSGKNNIKYKVYQGSEGNTIS